MIEIEEQAFSTAPPEVVYGLLNTPEESVRCTPSQTIKGEIEELPNGGKAHDYAYTMAGVTLTGHIESIPTDPPHERVSHFHGGIDATLTFTLTENVSVGTELVCRAEYSLPNVVLEAVAAPVVKRYNRREVRTFLENVSDRADAHFDPTGDEYGEYGLSDAPWEPMPRPDD